MQGLGDRSQRLYLLHHPGGGVGEDLRCHRRARLENPPRLRQAAGTPDAPQRNLRAHRTLDHDQNQVRGDGYSQQGRHPLRSDPVDEGVDRGSIVARHRHRGRGGSSRARQILLGRQSHQDVGQPDGSDAFASARRAHRRDPAAGSRLHRSSGGGDPRFRRTRPAAQGRSSLCDIRDLRLGIWHTCHLSKHFHTKHLRSNLTCYGKIISCSLVYCIPEWLTIRKSVSKEEAMPVTAQQSPPTVTDGPYFRWLQLAMGIVCMAMIANLQYGWTLFVDPIDAKYHWGRAAIQLAFTLFVVTETWLVPIEAWFVDKYGPRVVIMFGGVMIALAWILNSYADSLLLLYVAAIIAGIGAGSVYGTCVG